MSANLLFESDLFQEETEIWKKCGASVHECFLDERKIKNFAPTVARGSIQFDFSVAAAFRQKNWPDLKWPFNNPWQSYSYESLGWLPKEFLLNDEVQTHLTNQIGSLRITPNVLDHESWSDMIEWPVWIRSDAGTKGLAGGVYTREQFKVWIEYARQNNLMDMKLVVAKPKKIYEEHRLIFVDSKYVSGSEYHADGRQPKDGFVPKATLGFGIEWARKYGHNWKGNFVLDIAATDNGLKVVEVNNLLTSGWYAADLEGIIVKICHTVSTL